MDDFVTSSTTPVNDKKSDKQLRITAELWIDDDGKANFQTHFTGDVSFVEARSALILFAEKILLQIDNQKNCPLSIRDGVEILSK